MIEEKNHLKKDLKYIPPHKKQTQDVSKSLHSVNNISNNFIFNIYLENRTKINSNLYETTEFIMNKTRLTNNRSLKYIKNKREKHIYDEELLKLEYKEYYESDFLDKYFGVFDVDKGSYTYSLKTNQYEEVLIEKYIIEEIRNNYFNFKELSKKFLIKLLEPISKIINNKRNKWRSHTIMYRKYLDYYRSSNPFILGIYDNRMKKELKDILNIYISLYTINKENRKIIREPYKISNEYISKQRFYTSSIKYLYYFIYFIAIYYEIIGSEIPDNIKTIYVNDVVDKNKISKNEYYRIIKNKSIDLYHSVDYIKKVLSIILKYINDNINNNNINNNIYSLTSILDNKDNVNVYNIDNLNKSIGINDFNIFCNCNNSKIFPIEITLKEGNYCPDLIEERISLNKLFKMNCIGQINITNLYSKKINNMKKLYLFKKKVSDTNFTRFDKEQDILCVSQYLYPYEIGSLSGLRKIQYTNFLNTSITQCMYYYNCTCDKQEYYKSVNYFSKYSPEDLYNIYKAIENDKRLLSSNIRDLVDSKFITSLKNNNSNTTPISSEDNISNIINRKFNSRLELRNSIEEIILIPNVLKVIFEMKKRFILKNNDIIENIVTIRYVYFNGLYIEIYKCIGNPTDYRGTYEKLKNSVIRDSNLKTPDDIIEKRQRNLKKLFIGNRLFKKELLIGTLNLLKEEITLEKICNKLLDKYKKIIPREKYEEYKSEIDYYIINLRSENKYRRDYLISKSGINKLYIILKNIIDIGICETKMTEEEINKIASDFFNNKIIRKENNSIIKPPSNQDKPYAIVMVGGPASGKTTGRNETIKSLLGISDIRDPKNNFVVINPDEILMKFFEGNYECMNYIYKINNYILDKTTNKRYNLVYDRTGRNYNETRFKIIGKLNKLGYNVVLCMVYTKSNIAEKRERQRLINTQRNVGTEFVIKATKQVINVFPLYLNINPEKIWGLFVYNNNKSFENGGIEEILGIKNIKETGFNFNKYLNNENKNTFKIIGGGFIKKNIKLNKIDKNIKLNNLYKYFYNNIYINNILIQKKNNLFNFNYDDYIFLYKDRSFAIHTTYSKIIKLILKKKYSIYDILIKKYNIKYNSIFEINDHIYFIKYFQDKKKIKKYFLNLNQYNYSILLESDIKRLIYYKDININFYNNYIDKKLLNKKFIKKDLIITSLSSDPLIKRLFLEHSNVQLIFNTLLLSILNLNKNGSIIYIIRYLNLKVTADVIIIFKKFFKETHLTIKDVSSKFRLSGVYLILKGFKGISKKELNKLLNIFNILYKNDPTSKSFNIKDKSIRNPKIKYINKIPKTVNLELNIIEKIEKPITKDSVFKYPSSLLNLPLDSSEYDFIKEFNKNHIMDKIIFNYKFYYNIKKYYGKQISNKVREKQFLFSYLYALNNKLEMVNFNKFSTFKRYLGKLEKISIETIYQYHIPVCYSLTSNLNYDLIIRDIQEFLDQRVREFEILENRIKKIEWTNNNCSFHNIYYKYSNLYKLLSKRFKYVITIDWFNLYNILKKFKIFSKIKNIKYIIKSKIDKYNDIENCINEFYRRRKIKINTKNILNNLIYTDNINNINKNLKYLKENGCLIVKLKNPFNNKKILKLIYKLYNSFTNIYLYKEQSHMYLNNIYIICKKYKKQSNKMDYKKNKNFILHLIKGLNDIFNYKIFEIDREIYFVNNYKTIPSKIKKEIKKLYNLRNKKICKEL